MKPNQDPLFKLRIAPNGVEYLYIPVLDDTGLVRTFFTTRRGGVSTGAYDSLNFGKYTEDNIENVKENRSRLFSALSIEKPVLVFPRQVHGDAIACLTESDIAGQENITIEETDAVITKLRHVILTTVHADCLVVYLLDPVNKVIGLVHAGWRGTRENIVAKTLDQMVDKLGAAREDMMAVIGPGLSACCFEVGPEVFFEFKLKFDYTEEYAKPMRQGKYLIDLKGLNTRQLEDAGVKQIHVTQYCTSCHPELFFSHRRDHGVTGRMGAGISLL